LAINFSGEFTTPRAPDEVFEFLSDPNRFGPLLPDFQSMSMQDPTHFTVKVKVGVGNIRGTAELKMELTEAVRPLRAQYKGQGTAVGSQVTVSAGFDLTPLPEGTKVLWQGETSIFGKLASMAGGMLEPLGRKNIQKLIEGLQKALSEPATAPPVNTAAPPITTSDNVGVPQSGTEAADPSILSSATAVPEAAIPASVETTPAQASPTQTTPAEPSKGEAAPLEAAPLEAAPVEAPGFSRVNKDS
jgi:carbon monoxide dehydrogenase subunit G